MKRTELKRGNSQMKRTPLERVTSQLKRTEIRRVGKIGRANIKANKILKDVLADIDSCELKYVTVGGCEFKKDCLGSMYLTNAHRHKRSWYKGDVDLLSDRNQVIKACVNCHDKIEHNAVLTETIFKSLRGSEETGEKDVDNYSINY